MIFKNANGQTRDTEQDEGEKVTAIRDVFGCRHWDDEIVCVCWLRL